MSFRRMYRLSLTNRRNSQFVFLMSKVIINDSVILSEAKSQLDNL